jgi:hypothetical protein
MLEGIRSEERILVDLRLENREDDGIVTLIPTLYSENRF